MTPRPAAAALLTAVAALTSVAPGALRAAPPDSAGDRSLRIHASLRGVPADRVVPVYVVLRGAPALAAAPERGAAGALGAAATEARVEAIAARQAAVRPRLEALGARVVAAYQRLANAFQLDVPAGRLRDIATLPGVLRIDPVGVYRVADTSGVSLIGAPQVWQRGPALGDGSGIRIAVIDTGIDYTHADFGGPGTPAAYSGVDPTTASPGTFPTAKVVDGYDFVGDGYDPSKGTTPHPDPNPLDCPPPTSPNDRRPCGHGTHVAGIAAGYGVTNGGATYAGLYYASVDFSQFAIPPGVAPKASLVALKVFGIGPTTDQVGPALEWLADPSHHVDVVNLSLGCDFSCGSPTELQMVDNLAAAGTFVAGAAGNAGNTFFITDDPGNAGRATSVAATVGSGVVVSAIQVTQPSSIAGKYGAAEGAITAPLALTGPVTGTLAYVQPSDACSGLTNGSSVRGKIALIDRGTCLFSTKILNAQSAGAVAVVMVNNTAGDPIVMGGSGSGISIPGVMIGQADGTAIKAHLGEGVTVRLDASLTLPRPDLADRVVDFSARGPSWPDGALKPDLAAPGYDIVSADVATGNGGVEMSGTSMATPHVAGSAALVKQTHPDYSAEDIKAALMNTAATPHDGGGSPYPESRVGAGRVEVDGAVDTPLTAVGDGPAGTVGMSLGTLILSDPISETRQVTVSNHGSQPTEVTISVVPTLDMSGVSLTPLQASVNVPAGGSASAQLLLRADPRLFAPANDPTTPPTQAGEPRQVVPEASGEIVITPGSGAAPIHVPYQGVFEAASDLRSGVGSVCVPSGSGVQTVSIPINGTSAHPHPVVTAFQLGATSPDQHPSDPMSASANVVAVGAATDAATHASFSDGSIYFGIVTSGPWATPQPFLVQFEVHIDTNRDGIDDYVLSTQNYGTLQGTDLTDTSTATDTFVTAVKRAGATGNPTFDSFVNIAPAGVLDTAPFDSNVLVMPVKISSLGLTSANATFDYTVKSYAGGQVFETTPKATFDAARPAIDTGDPADSGLPVYLDGASIVARVDTSVVTPSNPGQVLLLYHTNLPGERSEIVTVGGSTSADLGIAASSLPPVAAVGRPVATTLRVTNAGPGVASDATLTDTLPPGVALQSAAASQGSCSATADTVICTLGAITAGGSASVTVTFTPSSAATLTEVATVTSDACDPDPADNATAVRTIVASSVRRHVPRR